MIKMNNRIVYERNIFNCMKNEKNTTTRTHLYYFMALFHTISVPYFLCTSFYFFCTFYFMCFNTETADDTDQEDEQTMTIQAKNILIQSNMLL